jgi:RNase H-fold protein (predicted Holliday junction resolvase)
MSGPILAIDPGTRKAGYAVVAPAGAVATQGIVGAERLLELARELCSAHKVVTIALGEGTNAGPVQLELSILGLPIVLIDERETTLRARALYFRENPPRGWRRFIPRGMQLPPRPIDDYAAVLIGRRYLTREDLPSPS